MFNWVRAELEKMLSAEKTVTEIGKVKVLAIFRTDKSFMIVGGKVTEGRKNKHSRARAS